MWPARDVFPSAWIRHGMLVLCKYTPNSIISRFTVKRTVDIDR